jgi:hypothetical protein
VLTVAGSKKDWMKALWLAWSNTAGHTLPERNRSHAETTPTLTTVALKHATLYQAGPPAL